MNDADGKNSVKLLGAEDVQLSNRKKNKKKLGTDEFALAIARIAVAQVCESLGFQTFQQSALDCLADVGVRYIRDIGKVASSYANLANRSQCNVFDVIQCLEDLGSAQGFLGASDVGHSLSGSGVVRDIIRYVTKAEEIPFAYLIPVFPVVKERKVEPAFSVTDEAPALDHIPSWLPKFPDPSTYTNVNFDNEKNSESKLVNKIQQVDDQVERPLNNLQQKFIRNVSEARVASEALDVARVQLTVDGNPFLAPPVYFGEKKVSLPIIPTRFLEEEVGYHHSCDAMENHGLSSEKYLQGDEALTCHTRENEDRGKFLSNERPCVKFELRNNKRFRATVRSLQNEGSRDFAVSFGIGHDGEDLK